MFLARMVTFRLHESPRFLVHAGRHQEALESLQMISKFNGNNIVLALEDVDDQRPQAVSFPQQVIHNNDQDQSLDEDEDSTPFLQRKSPTELEAGEDIIPASEPRATIFDAGIAHYSSTGESSTALGAHVFATPVVEFDVPASLTQRMDLDNNKLSNENTPSASAGDSSHITVDIMPPRRPRLQSNLSRRRSLSIKSRRASSESIYGRKIYGLLPRWLRRPLWAWCDRVMMVLSPEWLRTTVLVWVVWWGMSLGTSRFLPSFLFSLG